MCGFDRVLEMGMKFYRQHKVRADLPPDRWFFLFACILTASKPDQSAISHVREESIHFVRLSKKNPIHQNHQKHRTC